MGYLLPCDTTLLAIGNGRILWVRAFMGDAEARKLFPTQAESKPVSFLDVDLATGAPYGPLSRSFLKIPSSLAKCQQTITPAERDSILALRHRFNVGDYQEPYISDIARAFRLIEGRKVYLEIGTFDRGNLAYVASLLSEDAILIGLDVVDAPKQDQLLRECLRLGQTYIPIVGSSRDPETVLAVGRALLGKQIDAMFIDGDHTAYGVMSDYSNYEGLVANDGVILFHDSVWEGTPQHKGSADALAEIDKFDAVYLIDGDNPVRRYIRPLWRNELWGVVGVIFAWDQFWRR